MHQYSSKNCLHCNEQLPTNTKNKFCNSSCSASYNNKGVRRHGNSPKQCLQCNQKVKRNSSKYCSSKCHGLWRHMQVVQQTINNGTMKCTGNRTIRNILISILGYQCSCCNKRTWMKQPIPIEIDHIDGNSTNNDLKNLRLICCNCHALTPTYKGKNKGNGRHYRRIRYAQSKSY